MVRTKNRELADLADPFEAPYVLSQPRPQKVGISGGEIRVEYSAAVNTLPLDSSELFMRFAKLSAHGAPSETKMRNWVSRYGLPARTLRWSRPERERDKSRRRSISLEDAAKIPKDRRYTNPANAGKKSDAARKIDIPGRDPVTMPVKEFRTEARYAYDLLRLYLDLKGGDAGAIRAKVKSGGDSYALRLNQQFAEAYKVSKHRWKLSAGKRPRPETRDHMTLLAARAALAEILTSLVADVQLRVGIQDMRGFASSWECPDLHSAIYLQFYRLVTKEKPIDYCANRSCGQPFEKIPSHKEFCTPSCKSNESYHRRKERSGAAHT